MFLNTTTATPFLARFPAKKMTGCTNASRDLQHTPPRDGLTPDSLPSPAKSVRAYATSELNFLGWMVYQILLLMVLRWRALRAGSSAKIFTRHYLLSFQYPKPLVRITNKLVLTAIQLILSIRWDFAFIARVHCSPILSGLSSSGSVVNKIITRF